MRLFHGTNRKIINLKIDSFLTADFQDATVFDNIKNGDIVYGFEVNETQVKRDIYTPQAKWYISLGKLKPIRAHSI